MTPTRSKRNNPRERESDKHHVRFNGEISIGTILSMVAMVLSLYGFYNAAGEKYAQENQKITDKLNSVDKRLAIVETQVNAMWQRFQTLTKTGD